MKDTAKGIIRVQGTLTGRWTAEEKQARAEKQAETEKQPSKPGALE